MLPKNKHARKPTSGTEDFTMEKTEMVTTMTTHNEIQATKKRKKVPVVKVASNAKSTNDKTNDKWKEPKAQNKKQKTTKRGVSQKGMTRDDNVDDTKILVPSNKTNKVDVFNLRFL